MRGGYFLEQLMRHLNSNGNISANRNRRHCANRVKIGNRLYGTSTSQKIKISKQTTFQNEHNES